MKQVRRRFVDGVLLLIVAWREWKEKTREWLGNWFVAIGLWLLEIEFWSMDEWEARDDEVDSL